MEKIWEGLDEAQLAYIRSLLDGAHIKYLLIEKPPRSFLPNSLLVNKVDYEKARAIVRAVDGGKDADDSNPLLSFFYGIYVVIKTVIKGLWGVDEKPKKDEPEEIIDPSVKKHHKHMKDS